MKAVKRIAIFLLVYAGIVVAFESTIGYLQTENAGTLVLTTRAADGIPIDRVLTVHENDGQLTVADEDRLVEGRGAKCVSQFLDARALAEKLHAHSDIRDGVTPRAKDASHDRSAATARFQRDDAGLRSEARHLGANEEVPGCRDRDLVRAPTKLFE